MREKTEILENAVYTANEVRQILGVSGTRIREFLTSGKLKAVKIGKSYKILGKDILQLLKDLQIGEEKHQKEK